MVVAHPCEGRLHCVLSLNYSLRAHAIAVTLPATPLADGKPLVGRTQGVLISKSQGAEQDWHTQIFGTPLTKLTAEMHGSELEKEREEEKERREGGGEKSCEGMRIS